MKRPKQKREAVDRGTPETLKKLKTDVVLGLHIDGKLSKGHLAAAEQIRDIHQVIGKALFPMARMDGTNGRQSRGTPLAPLERMSKEQYYQWKNFYAPWTKLVPRHILAIVIAVVIDNRGPYQLEEYLDIRDSEPVVVPLVRDALRQYAELAGLITLRAA